LFPINKRRQILVGTVLEFGAGIIQVNMNTVILTGMRCYFERRTNVLLAFEAQIIQVVPNK